MLLMYEIAPYFERNHLIRRRTLVWVLSAVFLWFLMVWQKFINDSVFSLAGGSGTGIFLVDFNLLVMIHAHHWLLPGGQRERENSKAWQRRDGVGVGSVSAFGFVLVRLLVCCINPWSPACNQQNHARIAWALSWLYSWLQRINNPELTNRCSQVWFSETLSLIGLQLNIDVSSSSAVGERWSTTQTMLLRNIWVWAMVIRNVWWTVWFVTNACGVGVWWQRSARRANKHLLRRERQQQRAESREFRVKFQRLQQCSRFDSCDKLEEFESWYCGFWFDLPASLENLILIVIMLECVVMGRV